MTQLKKLSWYYRMLLSYLPVFLAVISLVIVIFALAINEVNQRQAAKANEKFAGYVMQIIDKSLKNVDQMLIQEIKSGEKINLFYVQAQDGGRLANYEVSKRLQDIMISYPLINSMYLYRTQDRTVLSNNGLVSLEEFGDREFILQWFDQPVPSSWTNARAYKDYMYQNSQSVVSLIRRVPLLTGEEGIIVINIQVDTIQSLINSMVDSRVSYLLLLDSNGKSLFGEEIRLHNDDLTDSVKGGVRVTSSYTGWEVVSGTKPELFAFVHALSYAWIVLTLIAVIAGILWIVHVTRRNYRPIESMMNRIQRFTSQENILLLGKEKDELKLIDQALDKLMEQSNQFQENMGKERAARRKHFFRELTEGSRQIEPEEWEIMMSGLGMPSSYRGIGTALVTIDQYADFCRLYSLRDQHLFKFVLSSVVQELSSSEQLFAWSEWVSEYQLAVIFLWTSEPDNGSTRLDAICEKYRLWVEANAKLKVTIGTGSLVYRLEDIPQALDEAAEALKYKAVLGGNRVISYDGMRGLPKGEIFSHLQWIRTLSQTFRLGEPAWKDQLGVLFTELSRSIFSRDDVASLLNYLVYYLYREMMELGHEFQNLWKNETLPRLNQELDRFETLDETRQQIEQILEEAVLCMQDLRDKRSHRSTILEAKGYIEAHYASPELSLSQVSETFNLNPTYLSKLFKDELGEKFVDYVARVRMEEAKRLLTETDASIQDISAQVGYSYVISFNRAFKKLVGMPPGEYRKARVH